MAKKNKFARDINGLLVLDKPLGLSSNHALQRVRHLFNAKKAGHTGTLDPLASGVLVLCFGRATKIAEHVMAARKSYYVVARLGIQTNTGDKEGQVVSKVNVTDKHLLHLDQTIKKYTGQIEQLAPMFSALKKDGVALYKYARQGRQVERARRRVLIYSIVTESIQDDRLAMTVDCSKGTYIRSLVEDIGAELGCGAHVHALRRLAVGEFGLARKMYTCDELRAHAHGGSKALARLVLPIETALLAYPRAELKHGLLLALEQGARLKIPEEISGDYMRIYDTDRIFRGLGRKDENGFVHFSKFSTLRAN